MAPIRKHGPYVLATAESEKPMKTVNFFWSRAHSITCATPIYSPLSGSVIGLHVCMHPKSKHWHQLDLIITRRQHVKRVCITRVYHGKYCDNDHYLICTKVAPCLACLLDTDQFIYSSNRGFARQPCWMAGPIDSFSHGNKCSF